MAECHPVSVPMPAGEIPKKPEKWEQLPDYERRTYQAMIGSLGYMMCCLRPDMSFAV